MTISNTAASSHDVSVRAYEDLRGHVLAGPPLGNQFGLVVLLREGVAAWIARRLAKSAAIGPTGPIPRAAAPVLSNEFQAGVVRLLAGMALAGRGEMSP